MKRFSNKRLEVVVRRICTAYNSQPARDTEIFKLRMQGHTLKEIGDRYGLTKEMIRAKCRRIARFLEKDNKE